MTAPAQNVPAPSWAWAPPSVLPAGAYQWRATTDDAALAAVALGRTSGPLPDVVVVVIEDGALIAKQGGRLEPVPTA